ncbi:MAG TPA: hypothetical protein VMT46_08335 [Anaerolineaceae bacterium]|nr:hypothetical protein [Anaerolineaceae bacterium]
MPAATESTWTWAWAWWGTLVTINAINLILCIFLFIRSTKDPHPVDARYQGTMRMLGLVFLGVAFYRSIFVSSYLEQLAWFDSLLNSSLWIRFLAIFAELSFAGLIAKSLLRMNTDVPELIPAENRVAAFLQTRAPIVFFSCILIANFFATAATITKIDVLFAIEETLWGLAFLSIIPMLIMSLRKLFSYRNTAAWANTRRFRVLTIILSIFAIGYGFYSLFYHLPIEYWPSALAQLQMQNPEPAFQFGFQAVRDALLVVHETRDLNAWGGIGFIIWHTGYFSICGWMALFMMTGPVSSPPVEAGERSRAKARTV